MLVTGCLGQAKTSREEYSIYGEVLRNIYKNDYTPGDQKPTYVISAQTYDSGYSNRNFGKTAGLRASFRAKNKTAAVLELKFPVKYQIWVIGKPELDMVLKIDEKADEARRKSDNTSLGNKWSSFCVCCSWWEHFAETYPNSNGYYRFSRIGFSYNKSYAIVESEGRGACWSSNDSYLLIRSRKGWKIHKAWGVKSVV